MEMIISIFAAFIALVSLVITQLHRKRLLEMSFRMKLTPEFEGKLGERGFKQVFRFYGIKLKDAGKDDVTKGQIAYLVMAVNSIILWCYSANKKTMRSVKVFRKYLCKNNYFRLTFKNENTRKAWKYARHFITVIPRSSIDSYLKKFYPQEKYEEVEMLPKYSD
jgi:hypothetical protein